MSGVDPVISGHIHGGRLFPSDSYLELCEEKGETPEKAYKGTFNVRVPAELHREAVLYGISHDMSLNKVVEEALRHMVDSKKYSGASLLCEESSASAYK